MTEISLHKRQRIRLIVVSYYDLDKVLALLQQYSCSQYSWIITPIYLIT